MPRRREAVLVIGLLAGACGDDRSENCVVVCEREVGSCPRALDHGGASCEDLCDAARDRTPERCVSAAEAVYSCFVANVRFECRDDGTVRIEPPGACREETEACAECTGDPLVCIGS